MIDARSTRVGLALFFFTVSAVAGNSTGQLVPRVPLDGVPIVEPTSAGAGHRSARLIVKFADAARIRAESGRLVSRTGHDLREVERLLDGVPVSRLVRVPEARLAELEARAAERSGREQPDLAGLAMIGVDAGSRIDLGRRLAAMPVVEFAYIQAIGIEPPGDIAPPTPNHVAAQGYRGSDPGADADYGLALGYTGAGIRLSDCEYAWVSDHEDLVDIGIVHEPGQTTPDWVIAFGFDEHGTAVLGETSSPDNAYGVSGMAPGAEVYVYPEWSVEEDGRRVTSIVNAIADSAAGDVVLLEMQDGAFAPAEVDPAVWLAVKTGTDAGVVVVAAAGNGNQDLDSAFYDEYRSRGDSGAIIVGAGSSDTAHDKLDFSTFGERVNVHGWGENVFSVGYGDFAEYGGDKNQRYTARFSGTSSASPFVASAALLVQEAAVDRSGVRLSSHQIRDLLHETGLPQGSGPNIGPFVSIRNALDTLLAPPDLTLTGNCPGTVNLTVDDVTPNGEIALLWSGTLGSEPLTAGPCPGALLGLSSPDFVTRIPVDQDGSASITASPAPGRCDAFLQAIDLTTCSTSVVVTIP